MASSLVLLRIVWECLKWLNVFQFALSGVSWLTIGWKTLKHIHWSLKYTLDVFEFDISSLVCIGTTNDHVGSVLRCCVINFLFWYLKFCLAAEQNRYNHLQLWWSFSCKYEASTLFWCMMSACLCDNISNVWNTSQVIATQIGTMGTILHARFVISFLKNCHVQLFVLFTVVLYGLNQSCQGDTIWAISGKNRDFLFELLRLRIIHNIINLTKYNLWPKVVDHCFQWSIPCGILYQL